MAQDKSQPENRDKMLRNTIRMRRWLIIGGIAVGVQALLSLFSQPGSNAFIFHSILALGCIGYGLSMTPKIRRLAQAAENKKNEKMQEGLSSPFLHFVKNAD